MDDKDREIQRLRYALESIQFLCNIISEKVKAERALELFDIFKRRATDALNPKPDDVILQEWEDAELSEGMAHELLGVDRLKARQMLHDWQARQCAEHGHEWRELSSRRMVCVRCQTAKAWQEEGAE